MKKILISTFAALFFLNVQAQVLTMCTDVSTTNLTGNLEDSGGPGADYQNSENCGFLIDPGCADSITLTFNIFDIESGWDFFNVYDGADNSAPQLLNATGNIAPGPITATSGMMFIEFTSDGIISAPGFDVSWNVFVSPQNPVVASFTSSNTNPAYQEAVTFTDNSTSLPNQWFWDFGDGNTSTLQNPDHSYFTSGAQTVTLIASNCNFSDTTSTNITVQSPPFNTSVDTIKMTVNCGGGIASQNITFNNTGGTQLGYELQSDLPLDTVLNRINNNHTSLTALVPSLHLITDGIVGNSISDGGNDMYDTGNKLNTNISGVNNIDYSDNTIIASPDFGPNGKYFTRKVDGLFVMAADLDNVDIFNITGNLGADGSGNSDGTILTSNRYGSTYRAFINRTHGTTDPSINRMVIVQDNPTASHTFLTTTDDEDHEVSGLASSKRVYYLLFAAQNGLFIDDSQMQTIMDEFLGLLETIPSYVTITPMSDTIVANSSTTVGFSFNPVGLNAGTYINRYTIKNTTPPFATYYFYSEIEVIGTANLSVLDSCLNYGSILNDDVKNDTLVYENLGCADLVLNSVTSNNPSFEVISYDTVVTPGNSANVIISFTASGLGAINGDLAILTNANDTSVCLTGNSVGTPLTLSNDSLHYTIACGSGIQTQSITFYNDSLNALDYETVTGLPLDTVLNRVNRLNTDLTSQIPSLHLFTDGVLGNSISDGGNDMYDTGNRLNTDISGVNNIDYSDNLIIASTDFGPNGKYFTKKVDGLFVMAADLDNVSLLNVTGNLGADGSGNSDGVVLNTNAYGSTFRAFINRTYNAGDPSINRMIIVKDNPTAAHTFLTTTDDEDHEVTGLNSSKRVYYLLFASQSGLYVDDNQMQDIFEEFVNWLEAIPGYMTINPASATIAGNDSTVVTFSIDPLALQAGIYETELTVKNTTPPFSNHTINVTVEITGVADYVMSDTCIDLGILPPGDTIIDTLFYTNIGCDELIINSLVSSNGDFTIIGYDTNVAVGNTGYVLVGFSPTTVGTINGNLSFTTNVQDTVMCITGKGTNITSQFSTGVQDPCTAEIQFTNNTIGSSNSWFWDFGDGTTSTDENPSHLYDAAGNFNVQFISCNALGCDTSTQVVNSAFTLDYSINSTGLFEVGESIDFSLTGNAILSAAWNFGDGSAAPGLTTSHTFTNNDTYIVQVDIVTNGPCFITLYDSITIGSNNVFTLKDIDVQLYPNPNNGVFNVKVNNTSNDIDLEVLNSLGQVVYTKTNINKTEEKVAISNTTGLYLLRLSKDGQSIYEKSILINE